MTEFQTAHNKKIPIYTFIEKDVLAAYRIHQHNKDTLIDYPYVDNIQIFDFIEKVYAPNIYWIKAFDKTDDIINELRNQWARLFANYLINLQYEEQLKVKQAKKKKK